MLMRIERPSNGRRQHSALEELGVSQAQEKIKVLLVDDHTLFRQGVRALLQTHRDIEVVGEAWNGKEALAEAIKLRPDVIIMDIAMPIMNGIEATCQICKQVKGTKVLVLTTHAYEENILELMEMGAYGYLFKDAEAGELLLAIRKVHHGHSYLSPSLSAKSIQEYLRRSRVRKASKNGLLSSREREVLQLVAEGYSNRQVGELLFISPKTVEAHKASIIHKLDIKGGAELVKYAVVRGLVDVET